MPKSKANTQKKAAPSASSAAASGKKHAVANPRSQLLSRNASVTATAYSPTVAAVVYFHLKNVTHSMKVDNTTSVVPTFNLGHTTRAQLADAVVLFLRNLVQEMVAAQRGVSRNFTTQHALIALQRLGIDDLKLHQVNMTVTTTSTKKGASKTNTKTYNVPSGSVGDLASTDYSPDIDPLRAPMAVLARAVFDPKGNANIGCFRKKTAGQQKATRSYKGGSDDRLSGGAILMPAELRRILLMSVPLRASVSRMTVNDKTLKRTKVSKPSVPARVVNLVWLALHCAVRDVVQTMRAKSCDHRRRLPQSSLARALAPEFVLTAGNDEEKLTTEWKESIFGTLHSSVNKGKIHLTKARAALGLVVAGANKENTGRYRLDGMRNSIIETYDNATSAPKEKVNRRWTGIYNGRLVVNALLINAAAAAAAGHTVYTGSHVAAGVADFLKDKKMNGARFSSRARQMVGPTRICYTHGMADPASLVLSAGYRSGLLMRRAKPSTVPHIDLSGKSKK